MRAVSSRGRTQTRSRTSRQANYPERDRQEQVPFRKAGAALVVHSHAPGRAARSRIQIESLLLPSARHLAPVPLPQNPAASLVDPAMRYPVGTRPWRLFPPARYPRITLAIVVVISPNPNIASARSMIPLLDNHPRRRDADHNIGRCGVENQGTRKDQSDQWLKNHNTIPFLLPDCESFHRQAHYQALLRLRA